VTDRFYPCRAIPASVRPVGARFLCYAAAGLLALLAWWHARRADPWECGDCGGDHAPWEPCR
jgi:hypothetical protein